MSEITLESLGLSEEEIQERIVNKVCDRILCNRYFAYEDEDDEETSEGFTGDSPFRAEIDKRINQAIEDKFRELADQHIMPHIAHRFENLLIEMTNQYGEKKGETYTLVEYLTKLTEDYMLEDVDRNGRPQGKRSWRDFDAEGTRIAYAVDSYLSKHMEQAMTEVLSSGEKTLSEGLVEVCKKQMEKVAKSIKVEVKRSR